MTARHGTARHGTAGVRHGLPCVLALAGLSLTLSACVDDPAPPVEHSARKSAKLSDPGAEKIVPVRFVNLLQCPTCADAATYQTILKAVDATNEVFKAAGVQFATRSIERYYLSNFTDFRSASCGNASNGDTLRLWPNVYQELVQVFPALPWNAWPDNTPKTNNLWLRSAETLYGKTASPKRWWSGSVPTPAADTAIGRRPRGTDVK